MEMESLYWIFGMIVIMTIVDSILNVRGTESISATVISHSFTWDKNGYRTYGTILKRADGAVQESTSLEHYILEIGATTVVYRPFCKRRSFFKSKAAKI